MEEEKVETVTETSTKKENKKEKKKMKKGIKITLIIITSFIAIGIATGLFLLYGPYKGFREWLITTAMTTQSHQYLATWFYSDKTIQKVLSENVVIESGESTNTDLINQTPDFNIPSYANEYEKQILTKDPGNDLYKLIHIEGKGYKGYLVAIYDPSKVKVAVTNQLGTKGNYLTTIAKNNNAVVAINGGGFYDPTLSGAGGMPHGSVIKDGKIIWTFNRSNVGGGIIGFTNDNKLLLSSMSAKQALAEGVRDALEFGPFLIVNGKPSFIKGNGGWGTAPRTAIGQRKDGIVLFLVIDGRRLSYPGADMVDLTEIMSNYGAYNAANLDGGTSSALVINNELINDPIDSDGVHQTRPIASAFIVTQ